mmetsp:Transcript_27474/g.20633  ORF Transcript_27474/g.20633 Transcript_27474/m.20633 type:complete len:83 (+) Transcript_27474:559-807(+)
MAIHSVNQIFGACMNPHDTKRVCGGSSGGDGGLVGAKCVPLSVGSDVGGSIRSPSAFNGICGFKPTSERCMFDGFIVGVKDF